MKSNESKNTHIRRKYLWSMYTDYFIDCLIIIPLFLYIFGNPSNEDAEMYAYPFFLFMFVVYFCSDIFFRNRSIGKRLFGIKIVHIYKNKDVKFYSILARRLVELTFHPIIGMSFKKKCKQIEEYTNTRIDLND